MYRGATARTVLSVLATVLVALQLPLLIPATPFASAHTTRPAMAEVQSGTETAVKAVRHAGAACQDVEKLGNPTSRTRPRVQHRLAGLSAVSQPALRRSLTSAGRDATQPAAASVPDCVSRPSRAHTPAALQVFRC